MAREVVVSVNFDHERVCALVDAAVRRVLDEREVLAYVWTDRATGRTHTHSTHST
jgi:hypothetical protein